VNAGNQLTADATHSYQYDENGNLTRKTLLATGNFSQYTYDAENRLTKVEEFAAGNPTPAFTSTYRYDGLGRRIEKVANGQTKRYIYDGEDILLEYDGANVLQARYTHGPGIDEPIAVTKGGSTFFYHQDGLGTVTELTDSAGTTAKSYSYDAYGTIVDQTGTVEQPYTYTGREFDAETGLYYYRERYYDSKTGRFLQQDPIGISGDLNLYAYVQNGPVNYIDPLGLQAAVPFPFPGPAVPFPWPPVAIPGSPENRAAGQATIEALNQLWDRINGIREWIDDGINGGEPPVLPNDPSLPIIPVIEIPGIGSACPIDPLIFSEEHTKGARKSTKDKHDKGETRKKKDRPGGEKGDARRPYRGKS
jgi:RHS repeat-associated protein